MSDTFSYSKIDTYEQCGFKYYLKYEAGHYLFNSSIATEIGTLIHETEEAIANAIITKQSIDYIALKNNIITKFYEIKHKYPKDAIELDKSDRTYDEKIYQYLNVGIYKLEQFMKDNPTYEIVGVEKEFNIVYKDGHKFKGFIDRVFYDTAINKYIIQDIKTYAIPVEQSKLTTPLQFVVYSMAVKELFNCEFEDISCQYYLPFCQLTQDAGTKGYIKRGMTKLDQLFNGIATKEFAPKPTPLCHWCDFCSTNPNAPEEGKYLCPYFSHWTRETKDFSKENNWIDLAAHPQILEAYQNKYCGQITITQ